MRVALSFLFLVCFVAEANDFRGAQFIGFDRFDKFEVRKSGEHLVFTSPIIRTEISWNELIASWNFRAPPEEGITIEGKAIFPNRETKWYTLAKWAKQPTAEHPRHSIKGQKDADGTVDTDTLKLNERASSFQVRIIMGHAADPVSLKFLGLSVCDSQAERAPLPPIKSGWGKILRVKERSQANFPEGINEWCSPTSTSMLLSFWSTNLNRPELDYDVPEVARAVHDPNWPGTGNWPFNTAFAGAHDGIRAYVTRFSDVSELEEWVNVGIPVAISVSYGFLKGQAERANGHLVVCIGFDEHGNIIVNDPGRSQVRQIYLRENLAKAWADSENTVYVLHPENHKVPPDRFGHWFHQ